MQKIKNPKKLKKIIVLCIAGIGDTLMVTPALRVLREECPSAQIDVLVMYEGSKNLLETSPDINRVIQWNFIKQGIQKSLEFCFKLRKNNYDVSLTAYPSNRPEYNIVSFIIGAKVRIGHKYNKKCVYGTDRFAFHERVPESPALELHNVEENLKLLNCLAIDLNKHTDHRLHLYLSPEDRQFAEQWLSRVRDPNTALMVGIHPGSGEINNSYLKRWSIGNFSKLADLLIREYNAQVFVFGGDNEKQLRYELVQYMTQKPILVENVSFRQTSAIIQHCDVFISVDTALMHAAAAVGTPTVALFGPTNPNLTAPWKTPHKIVYKNLPCQPCFFYSTTKFSCPAKRDVECIQTISVPAVTNCVETLLEDISCETPKRRRSLQRLYDDTTPGTS